MKFIKYILLLAIVAVFTRCTKEKTNNSINIPGLPPATQTGANTLGFLLNGMPWVPAGNNGTPNLTIGLDTGVNNVKFFIIGAYSDLPQNLTEFKISFPENASASFPVLINPSLLVGFVSFKDRDGCKRITSDPSNISNTSISISKYDKGKRIVSGNFDCKIYNPACGDTIRITHGRFDLKF